MNTELVVEYKGASTYLHKEAGKREKLISKEIGKILGSAEGKMKNSVPVKKGILKGSIWSEMLDKFTGQIYASVVYAHKANVTAINHERRNFIKKTAKYITQRLDRL